MNLNKEKNLLLDITIKTAQLSEKIRLSLMAEDVVKKEDLSPVTLADYSCQAVINYLINQQFPHDYLMGEEDSEQLRTHHALTDKILDYVQTVLPRIQRRELLELIDLGRYEGGKERYWTIDPIDGTKAYVRNEPYAIAIGLIDQGELLVSALGCPLDLTVTSTPLPQLFLAAKHEGAYAYTLPDLKSKKLRVTVSEGNEEVIYCEAHTSTKHHSHDAADKTIAQIAPKRHSIHLDSQCKYALVASARADVYIRFPKEKSRSKEDRENIWDHAPGHLIVEEAGGIVTDILGNKLDYTQGKVLNANEGIVASNAKLHSSIVSASKKIYEQLL